MILITLSFDVRCAFNFRQSEHTGEMEPGEFAADSEPPRKAHRTEDRESACASNHHLGTSTVVLKHLHSNVTKEEIAEIAKQFGVVKTVTVLEKEKFAGTAFVDFDAPDAAVRCVAGSAIWSSLAAHDSAVPLTVELKHGHTDSPAGAPQLNRKQRRALARGGAVDGSTSVDPDATTTPSTTSAKVPAVPTLYVHGDSIRAIFDVFNYFKERGIEGKLRDCVFVTTSRKPYFLVDCTGNDAFYKAALDCDSGTYKGEKVDVRSSGQTCAEYLQKKPDAMRSKKLEPLKPNNGGAPDSQDGGDRADVAAVAAIPVTAREAAAKMSLAFKPRTLKKT
jgi:hypothetical protein